MSQRSLTESPQPMSRQHDRPQNTTTETEAGPETVEPLGPAPDKLPQLDATGRNSPQLAATPAGHGHDSFPGVLWRTPVAAMDGYDLANVQKVDSVVAAAASGRATVIYREDPSLHRKVPLCVVVPVDAFTVNE